MSARSDSAPADSGWQPIETAPKGVWVLAGEFNNPDLIGDYYAAILLGADEAYWCANCGQPVVHSPEPTHWMPLPPPPVQS